MPAIVGLEGGRGGVDVGMRALQHQQFGGALRRPRILSGQRGQLQGQLRLRENRCAEGHRDQQQERPAHEGALAHARPHAAGRDLRVQLLLARRRIAAPDPGHDRLRPWPSAAHREQGQLLGRSGRIREQTPEEGARHVGGVTLRGGGNDSRHRRPSSRLGSAERHP
ncbi:hypothetical protein [Streptacidiphilus rugosus]|uniref:hypothetical protein n=1 Tax=Streptacidiphilus rugosus TaxID=405783 RepID=UPI00068D2D07|nr:hypothetical protein [Streptacidiphilus rugosus]